MMRSHGCVSNLAAGHLHFNSQRLGDDEDVAEKDGSIELISAKEMRVCDLGLRDCVCRGSREMTVPADRLQGALGNILWVLQELQKVLASLLLVLLRQQDVKDCPGLRGRRWNRLQVCLTCGCELG